MMQEQPSKPDVSSKTGSVEHNNSPNSIIDRREFLRHYKIKKKALPSENKTNDIIQPHIGDKVQNIHIAPWKAKEILPNIASSSTPPRDPRDPRLASTSTSRDPRITPDVQVEKEPIKLLRDPRVTSSRLESPVVSQRDPRLLSKPASSSPKPSPKPTHTIIGTNVSSTPTAALVQHPRDPRTVQAEKSVEKERESNSSKAKKEKEKEHIKSPKDSSTSKREKEKKVKPKESEKNKENEKIEEFKKTDKGNHSKKMDLDPKTVKTEAKKGIVKSEKKDSPKENAKESPKNKENKNQKSKEKDKIDKENLEKLNKEKAAEKSIREKAEKSNKEKVVEKLIKEKIEKPPKEKSVEKNIKEKDRQSKEKSLEKHIVSAAPKEDKETPSLKTKIKDLSLSPVEKFKSKGAMSENDNGSKRRKHIRPRVESPVEEIKDVKQEESLSQNTDNDRPSSTGSSSSSGKRSRNDRDSESEDIKGDNGMNVSAVPLASQSQSFNNPVKSDTDLRHFTPQQDSRHPVDIDKTDKMTELRPNPEKTLNLGLFGKEDVDLRQLSIMARVPHANQGTSAVLTNFGSKPDEDMRIQSNSRKENQDPRFNKSLDTFASPLRKEDDFADHNSKKTFYNSPHAAKWEKFREKNPEFKEYQRQASVSEKMDIDDRFSPPTENFHLPGKSGFGKWERGRRRYSHDRELCQRTDKLPKDFEPIDEEDTNKSSDENYKFMINQLTEQLKRGEINDNEFSRYMENIRFMVEKGKIRELQRKERGSSEGRWSPDRRSVTSLDSEEIWPKHPAEKVASNQQYIDDGRWSEGGNSRMDSWQRGHVRDHGPPVRGPGIRLCYGGHSRFEDEWTNEPDLPNIAEDVLRSVYRESQTKTIEIDGIPREIRTYGERAMILMDWDDPRTLTFEPVLCNIVFDNGTFVLPMSIGEGYREFIIDREVHRVRLGVPTQELMIDGKGYQCFFGGKPITVHLAGQNRTISLDGKLPKVIIGQTRNTNYLLGKIELIVNARKVIPLFLDAKPQRFTLDGKAFVIKFIDAFTKVNINGVKFPVEFGGLPISITVRGYRKFLRFLKLPSFVTPGKTTVRGMDTEGDTLIPAYPPSPPPPPVDIKRAPNFPASTSVAAPSPAPAPTPVATAPPLAPSLAPALPLAPSVTPATPLAPSVAPAVITSKVPSQHTPEINIPTTLPSGSTPGPFHFHSQPPPTSGGIPPGVVIQVRPPLHPNIRNVVPGSYLTSSGVSNKLQQPPPMFPIVPGNIPLFSQPPPSLPSNVSTAPASTASTSSSPAINVQDLLDRLVKTGIIGGQNSKKDPKKETKNEEDKHERKEMKESVEDEDELNFLKDIPSGEIMFSLDNLRNVYIGACSASSCGLRYPPEGTQQYSHHLDWHFRMNKKQQDSTKKVNTRKFYFTMEDWVQFEEIEDIEERVPSMFEVEGQMNSKSSPNENDDEEEEIPSVAVSPDPSLGVCPICHETFDQFYHQTTEDWHYKYAIQVDGINYHPGCHEDHLKVRVHVD
ncbi:Pre-mRNA cleavage complex 2 protein Pcf11, partial [Armadillidium vulgare]